MYAEPSRQQGIGYPGDILELCTERVMPESLRIGELAGIVYATTTQVRGYYNEPSLRKSLRKRREHAPILEAFEAGQHQNRWPRRSSAGSAHIDQDVAQRSGH
jgi:hypothetical protein